MTQSNVIAAPGLDEYFLDITGDLCPMTFVKTKLRLERLPAGAVLEVRLNAGEPLANVPRSAAEHGHAILTLAPEAPGSAVYRLRIRKA